MSDHRLDTTFRAACARFADRPALRQGAAVLRYREVADEASRLAGVLDAALARRTGPNPDRVAVYAHNSIDYLLSYLAVVFSGRVPVLIDRAFGERELTAIRSGCGVTAYLVDAESAAQFPLVPGSVVPLAGSTHALVTVPADGDVPDLLGDTAVCRFTSGTTGVPKCLEFSGFAVHSAARNWVAGTGLGAADRTLCLAAFTNGLAFNTSLLSTFLVGAELSVHPGLPTSAKIVRALADSRATRLVAFPFVYRMLADADLAAARFAGLDLAVSAGAELPADVRARFEKRYGVRIADYYGVAEAGPCTFERDPAYRRGLGTPLPGVVLRTRSRSAGRPEVQLRTSSMASRYLNAPGLLESRLDADGFYATGDLGHVEDGRLFITGRLSGPINLAGRKVDPREIEAVVKELDGVRDAVVFADTGADDQVLLHLAVVGRPPLGRAGLVTGCRDRLAAYKVPQRISFVTEIPRSSTGKVRLTDLRAVVAESADRPEGGIRS
ncbi:class I adenylate-forming enzyme family protein [Micromonospora sp. NPDC004551]|uniref:class I adenylate-forming enzyme family protein n=1 Tax=Micromonospora sp. NPDC004551 TaxID=3154284 RepID=UPI0033A4F69D